MSRSAVVSLGGGADAALLFGCVFALFSALAIYWVPLPPRFRSTEYIPIE